MWRREFQREIGSRAIAQTASAAPAKALAIHWETPLLWILVREAIQELPPAQARDFWAVDVLGYPAKEWAAVLGYRRTSVQPSLQKARHRLRMHWAEEAGRHLNQPFCWWGRYTRGRPATCRRVRPAWNLPSRGSVAGITPCTTHSRFVWECACGQRRTYVRPRSTGCGRMTTNASCQWPANNETDPGPSTGPGSTVRRLRQSRLLGEDRSRQGPLPEERVHCGSTQCQPLSRYLPCAGPGPGRSSRHGCGR